MTSRLLAFLALLVVAAGFVTCGDDGDGHVPNITGPQTMALMSNAFEPGETIPEEFTCEGDDHSPPLAWTGAPGNAASLAVLIEDPDAPSGNFVHWLVFGLPAGTSSLAQAASPGNLPGGAHEAKNDFDRVRYNGPCPPRGDEPHEYVFRVFALDSTLEDAGKDLPAKDVERAIAGHVLAEGQLRARFGR